MSPKVRVARRLDELPLVTAAFACGELSYSKVRALTRIAVPATEADLVSMARHATGAQIERLAAGRRKVDRLEAEHDGDGDPGYSVRWWHDEGDAVVINARLAPEAGAVVVKALQEAIRQERATRTESHRPAETDAEGGPGTERDDSSDGNDSRKCSAEHSPTHPPDHDDTDDEDFGGPEQGGRAGGSGSRKCSAEHSPRKGVRCPAGVRLPQP